MTIIPGGVKLLAQAVGMTALLFLSSFLPAGAQSPEQPDVEIDTSVLQELNRYYGAQESAKPEQVAPRLSRPETRPEKRTLTVVPAKPESFPIEETHAREETHTDGLSEATKAALFPPPAPEHKPLSVPAEVSSLVAPTTQTPKTPPLPPRRPSIQEASASFVAKAREKTLPPARGLAMPAVPKAPVTAVPLKEKIVRGVEEIARQTGDERVDITAPVAPAEETSAAFPRPPPTSDHLLDFVTLLFPPEDTAITPAQETVLKNNVVALLLQNPGWRLQIQSFAGAEGKGGNEARRISLSRALSICSFLIAQGIDAPRMDVRALGMQTDRPPFDRADLVFLPPET
ncbi:MAG: OmpA family protein [Alphaproteobacteria bacterium]|nr:OmpA family protein [Alphaproteobacteria bacterium]